uniref:Macaca fascicularis brain cDNA clone: QbsA-11357, similar to human synapse associated protein 1, SAP47 homolog (Drosophila)(SYAP1), mRNA, RefSeq: NM_032796.2 n=1 Tax=Macaca fascicularis TaxID=9541 RepID=I7GKC1_MACFA|nr:unnamed protein product [Macaca fascicularis]
MVAGACNPSC